MASMLNIDIIVNTDHLKWKWRLYSYDKLEFDAKCLCAEADDPEGKKWAFTIDVTKFLLLSEHRYETFDRAVRQLLAQAEAIEAEYRKPNELKVAEELMRD